MLRSVNIIFNLRNREVKIILYPKKKKKKKNTSRHEVRDRLKYQVPIEFKLESRADVKCVMLISVCLPFSRRKQKKNIQEKYREKWEPHARESNLYFGALSEILLVLILIQDANRILMVDFLGSLLIHSIESSFRRRLNNSLSSLMMLFVIYIRLSIIYPLTAVSTS